MTSVLVVDDDMAIRETLRVLMEDEGHTVIEASDGAEALKLMRSTQDRLVVLLDLVMPVDGQTVLQTIAEDARLRERHGYIVVTAGNDALVQTIEPYLDVVPAQVLRKPFDIDDLTAATDRALTYLAQPVRSSDAQKRI